MLTAVMICRSPQLNRGVLHLCCQAWFLTSRNCLNYVKLSRRNQRNTLTCIEMYHKIEHKHTPVTSQDCWWLPKKPIHPYSSTAASLQMRFVSWPFVRASASCSSRGILSPSYDVEQNMSSCDKWPAKTHSSGFLWGYPWWAPHTFDFLVYKQHAYYSCKYHTTYLLELCSPT